jgi:hypothetical protein
METTDRFDNDIAAGVLRGATPPCLSLYQPTHRRLPETQQDTIRFRNLVRTMEEALLRQYPKDEVRDLLEPFWALADDHQFWNHNRDGLAVLAAKDLFRVYRLQHTVAERVAVADRFLTKPLMRTLQSADRYQVLGVNRKEVRLFEGGVDSLDEVALAPGVPRTITDALGDQLTEPHTTFRSGGHGTTLHHGSGTKDEEVDVDAERFFRAVDRAVLEHHSKPSGLPLILAALPEHHHLFREVSRNPFLVPEGIDTHPGAMRSLDELRLRAWEVIEPHHLARMAALADEYGIAASKGLGGAEAREVAGAIRDGRVSTLLLEAEREMPGRVDTATGDVRTDTDDTTADVLDDLAGWARRMGGAVLVVPADRMPTDTGLAAIYRY